VENRLVDKKTGNNLIYRLIMFSEHTQIQEHFRFCLHLEANALIVCFAVLLRASDVPFDCKIHFFSWLHFCRRQMFHLITECFGGCLQTGKQLR